MRTALLITALTLVVATTTLALPAAGRMETPGHGSGSPHHRDAGSAGVANRPMSPVRAPSDGIVALSPVDVMVGPKSWSGAYIVVLADEPLATYEGGTAGLRATSPGVTGATRLDTEGDASRRYLAHLDAEQDRALGSIERALDRSVAVRFRYRHVLNGFSIGLTPGEASRLQDLPGIVQVTRSRVMPLATDSGPRWIGAPGVWDGSASGGEAGTMGEGIVVGIVDTGINIDHPSFAAVDKHGYEHRNPKGKFLGFCDPEHPRYDPKWQCNDKLIGVYSFIDEPPGNSFVPEDAGGHGSHTAGTVAGNFVSVPLRGPTIAITREISGVAPHANIVAYDACGGGGCPDEATIAALDQAVADQVDVVNYSISTSRESPWSQPVLQAFYRVREAGIFASVSAGNAGPSASTTGALPPWVLAVAAATHDRVMANQLRDLAGGDTPPPGDLSGGSMTSGYGPAPIVYAGSGSFANASGQVDDGKCNQPFPEGTWQGEIVVCNRGEIARLDKATNVRSGGAGGVVLVNTEAEGESLAYDAFGIPGVHLGFGPGAQLKSWLASGTGHTGRIGGTEVVSDPGMADIAAGFSGRGPAVAGVCCRRPDIGLQYRRLFGLLKPDIIAPGVDVLAAVASSEGSTTPEFGRYSGTSMSAPHLAGAAALVLAARPDWTVAEAQSALMTTAVTDTVRKQDGLTPADPFDQGSGRVDVRRAVAAGLVLDASPQQMAAADPATGGDPRQINLASFADPFCLDRCSWSRVVSGTLDHAMEWTATVVVDPDFAGLGVTVTPQRFRIAPGRRQLLVVEAFVEALPPDQWVFAHVFLHPGDASVPTAHMPVAVRPVRADIAPVHVAYGETAAGSSIMPGLRVNTSGPIRVDVSGLALGTAHHFSLLQDPTPGNRLDLITGTHLITIPVPTPARRIVFQVDASEAPDLDLFVGVDRNGDGLPQADEQLCVSAGETWTEYCELESTEPNQVYWAVIQSFTGSDDQPDDISVVTAIVPVEDEGNLVVTAPDRIVAGEPFDLQFDWSVSGLRTGDAWFGLLDVGSSPETRGDLGTIAFDLVGRSVPATPTPAPTAVPTVDPVTRAVFLPAARR